MDDEDISEFKGWRERFSTNPKQEIYTQLITELEIELKKNAIIFDDLKSTINELLEDHLKSALEVGIQASIHNFPSFTKDIRRAAEFISEFAYDSDEDSEYATSGETYEDAVNDDDSFYDGNSDIGSIKGDCDDLPVNHDGELLPDQHDCEILPDQPNCCTMPPNNYGYEILPNNHDCDILPGPLNFELLRDQRDCKILPDQEDCEILPDQRDCEIVLDQCGLEILPVQEECDILPDQEDCKILPDQEDCKILSDEEECEILPDQKECDILPDQEDCKILPDEEECEILPDQKECDILPDQSDFDQETMKTEQGDAAISNTKSCLVAQPVIANLIVKQSSPSLLRAANKVSYDGAVIKQDSPLPPGQSEANTFPTDDLCSADAKSDATIEQSQTSKFLTDCHLKGVPEKSRAKLLTMQPKVMVHRLEQSHINKKVCNSGSNSRVTISSSPEKASVQFERMMLNTSEEKWIQQEDFLPKDTEKSFEQNSTTTPKTTESLLDKTTPSPASKHNSRNEKETLSENTPPSKCGLDAGELQEEKIENNDLDISCELQYMPTPTKEKSPLKKHTPSPNSYQPITSGPEEKVVCEKMPRLEIESIEYIGSEVSCELKCKPTPKKKRGRPQKDIPLPKFLTSSPHKKHLGDEKVPLCNSRQNKSGLQQENIIPNEEEMISAELHSKITPDKQGRPNKERSIAVGDYLSENEDSNMDFENGSQDWSCSMETETNINKTDITPLLEHPVNTPSKNKQKSKQISSANKTPKTVMKPSKGLKQAVANLTTILPEQTVITEMQVEDPEITKVEIINTFLRAMRKTTDDDNIISALQRNYNCTYCEKAFLERSTLGKHLKRCPQVVQGIKRKPTNKTPKKEYQCQMCGSKYKGKGSFLRHYETRHNLKRPYKCLVCSWHFFTEEQLQLHCSSRHGISDTKKYKCPYCDVLFSRRNDLHYHCRKSHGGNKAYICSICLETFDDELVWKMHEQSHGYTCDVCMHVANSETELSAHIMSHLQVVSYKCDRCDRIFNRRNYFTKHMKVHMNEIQFS